MLVRKINGNWKPSENPGLEIGDTIDMTNPRQLILSKMCIAVGEDGEDLDAFDLYDIVDQDLVKELKAFKKHKHTEQIKEELESKKEELEAALIEAKAQNAKLAEAKELETMDWDDLKKKAVDAGVFKPSMKRPAVTKALAALIK